MQPTEREQLLLNAVLHPDLSVAVASCAAWQSQVVLEKAPYAETRLIPSVFARFSNGATGVELPPKFRGKARATFTQNMIMARELLPYLETLAASYPVIAIKGLAFCARYNGWSKRAMGDFDIHIRYGDMEEVCRRLEQDGWVPRYGMTWPSLLYRCALRRNSWGLSRGRAELDLHWRIADNEGERTLDRELWGRAQSFQVLGHRLLVPSVEVALIYSLAHGFRQGTRADSLQTVIDSTWLLRDCDDGLLARLIERTGLAREYRALRSILVGSGVPVSLDPGPEKAGAPTGVVKPATKMPGILERIRQRRASRVPRSRFERKLVRSPAVYRGWEAIGRPRLLEMLYLRAFGPISRPLQPGQPARPFYDLRDCDVMDEVGGVGWSIPDPGHMFFWSDRADARLILPASRRQDYLLALTVSVYRIYSGAPDFAVLGNGHLLGLVNFRRTPQISTYFFSVPKRLVFADWLEVSFRPHNYASEQIAQSNYGHRISIPAQRVELIGVCDRLPALLDLPVVPPLLEMIQRGEEPYKSRFERLKARMDVSVWKDSNELPPGFDPVLYLLNNPGLFEAEVDPYQHYVHWGRAEGRQWR
jgi:hypothetical protein